jgi:hypothetical protein
MTETELAYPKFSDFNTNHKVFDGKKISIETILNNEILIKAFKIGASKFKTKEYATIQFNYKNPENNNENYIVFTGSGVVIDQLNQNKEHLPFFTIIRKIDKYYTLS